MPKLRVSAAEALEGAIFDGMVIAAGGFGLCGIPRDLIEAVRDSGVKDLTVVSNNMGIDGQGLGLLLENGQVARVVASTATQSTPRWRLAATSDIVDRNASRQAVKTASGAFTKTEPVSASVCRP